MSRVLEKIKMNISSVKKDQDERKTHLMQRNHLYLDYSQCLWKSIPQRGQRGTITNKIRVLNNYK